MACIVCGCAMASDVMPLENGEYLITARAAPARGGAAGAVQVAYKDADAFCQKQGGKAVVIATGDRDVYQGGGGGSWNAQGGSFGGGVFAAGNASMRFRCQK